MSFIKKARKGLKKAEKSVKKAERKTTSSIKSPFDLPPQHTLFQLPKPIKKAEQKATKPLRKIGKKVSEVAETVGEKSVEVAKFAVKPSSLVVEGEIAEITGDILIPIGGATGQPELIAAGVALKTGGKQVKKAGKIGQKVEKIADKNKGKDKDQGPSLEDILDILGDINDATIQHPALSESNIKIIKEEAKNITDLSNQVSQLGRDLRRDQEIIEQEEKIIEKEENIISAAIDTINELADRLDEAQTPQKSFEDFKRLAANIEELDKMDFIRRNWSQLKKLKQNKLFEIYEILRIGV